MQIEASRAVRTAVVSLAMGLLLSGSAHAIDLFDGRLEIHGFYEAQIRTIANDFDAKDNWDLTQFAHVLNLEIEAAIAPDGWGPFDLIDAFSRIEVRYDCVWTRACGMFPSVNAFGDGAKRLPKRLFNGRRTGYFGAVQNGDIRRWRGESPEQHRWIFRNVPRLSRRPFGIESTEAFETVFTSPGEDGVLGTADDPGPFYFDVYYRDDRTCKFSARRTQGYTDGVGVQNLGPIDPACDVIPNAAFIGKPNPFRSGDFNPLTGGGGGGALPYRPAPLLSNTAPAPKDQPRGLWIPNAKLSELLREGEIDRPPLNFSQNDLAWNHGASQGSEKELKELYVDLEMFDSRLWLRLGRQTIVWGKTELFRNQDQFNPQDLALSSLPALEESRTPLWSARGAWSFYDIGPLQDVRLEVGVNYDEIEPNDLGRCGEPYAVVLVCAGTFGFLAHGFEAKGLVGERRPPDPWNSWSGIEAGARLEFRWERFSFALTDFYGYSDLPYLEKIFTFERNVDPRTGRPRRLNSRGACRTGTEDACLGPGTDALYNHSSNQTLFAKNCAATFGIVDLDTTACGLSVFNSTVNSDETQVFAPPLLLALNNVYSGQVIDTVGGGAIFEGLANFNQNTLDALSVFPDVLTFDSQNFGPGTPSPLVPLSRDPNDGPPGTADPFDFGSLLFLPTGLQPYLTDEQEALLGCGAFFQTACDEQGIDLLNTEASALLQSFVGFDGTFGDWDTTDRSRAQPGTVGFRGGPVCTRFEGGRIYILPGCRGRGDEGYDVLVDGSTNGPRALSPPIAFGDAYQRVQPFTGQEFRSEMSIFSWNFMMALVGFSLPEDENRIEGDEFDPDKPFRKNGCSFAKPQFCYAFSDFWNSVATKRRSVRAAGNGRFGRRDFQWHDGTPVVLRYDKRNVLGFSLDYAEDWSKSNWSFEATWFNNIPFNDNDEVDGITRADQYNLTISVDRPTFINFLNANRTFLFNTQWFFQYVDGYTKGFTSNGPWNVLLTFTAQTGYFRDRLIASFTGVFDVQSDSGAFLPQVSYRWTENASVSFGAAVFTGRFQSKTMEINPIASRNRTGRSADKDFVENGLSVIRARDEFFLKLRYTF